MKNVLRLAIGLLALACASTWFLTGHANGFSTIGGSLGLNQRDFRLYDNFTGHPRLHNNTNAHDNWPGYTEVELACWKGGAEWGSLAFGDGSGDTGGTNGVVGSGGANFDFFWSGEASGTGGLNSNINSMISGSSGGVLAFMQGPISDGWRIRYYENWIWEDGPGIVLGTDFQGVACHELGHALGLGHSGASGATMRPSISGSGIAQRSINADDQAGVQFVYGAASGGKPTITHIDGSLVLGGTVVVTGTGFSTSGNEVWLNDDGTGSDPVKVTGLNSTGGGTQISFTIPSGVEIAGGLHVKDGGSGGDSLSEGHPFGEGGFPPSVDWFDLIGPTTAATGQPLTYDIENAPVQSPYWLYVSLTLDGNTINGQEFDIGNIRKTLTTGTTSGAGTASWTSAPVPNRFSGLTVYLEARVDDNGGSGPTLDSNFLRLDVF